MRVIIDDGRYPAEAYAFLREGLSQAVSDVYGQKETIVDQRHVTPLQLCQALSKLAVERWGMLAPTVLKRWNIKTTMDFGNMVYLMIEYGYMNKTEQESQEDFRDLFAFTEAFAPCDRFEMKE